MNWRLAQSLDKLRKQINTIYPNRSRVSDGSIGDTSHASRTSDHNPWVKDSKGQPIVTAIDVTHDPENGVDGTHLAEALVASKDSRIKYVIWNKRITTRMAGGGFGWKPYNGINAHQHHVHISVMNNESLFDSTKEWDLSKLKSEIVSSPEVKPLPSSSLKELKMGDKGTDVLNLQKQLAVQGFLKVPDIDGDFGKITKSAVISFQKKYKLDADGIAGQATFAKLKELTKTEEPVKKLSSNDSELPESKVEDNSSQATTDSTEGVNANQVQVNENGSGDGNGSSTPQVAENITNVSTSNKTIPDNFVPEDKTVNVPAKEGTTETATKMTIAGYTVPVGVAAVFTAIQSLATQGFIDAKEVGTVVMTFVLNNTKYLFILIGLIIVGMMLKKLWKQITLWIEMYLNARADMHNIIIDKSKL